jgi:hypothetical protein
LEAADIPLPLSLPLRFPTALPTLEVPKLPHMLPAV